MLDIGSKAPDNQIVTHTGFEGVLSDHWSSGPLILFFYPKDDTTICTKQACSLQSSLSEFGSFGANVLGSSTGSVTSHHQFAEKHNLEFPLIADLGGQVARAYQAFRTLFRISKRITYVIGTDGRVIGRCHSELSVPAHLDMIRQTLG